MIQLRQLILISLSQYTYMFTYWVGFGSESPFSCIAEVHMQIAYHI